MSNNPIRLTDPTGHYEAECAGTENENCENKPGDIPLTHKDDPIPGSKKKRAYGGDDVYLIFRQYQETCGWWNNDCKADFGIEEFIGMWAMFESNGNPEAADVIATCVAQNLFVGGNNPAACRGGRCFNGVFNFMAAYSGGEGSLFQGPHNAAVAIHDKYYPVWGGAAALRATISKLGNKAYSRSSVISWNYRTGPSNWGNVAGGPHSWLAAVRQNDPPILEKNINGLAENTIYYYFGNAFYYSIAQKDYWTQIMGATANMAGNGEIVP